MLSDTEQVSTGDGFADQRTVAEMILPKMISDAGEELFIHQPGDI